MGEQPEDIKIQRWDGTQPEALVPYIGLVARRVWVQGPAVFVMLGEMVIRFTRPTHDRMIMMEFGTVDLATDPDMRQLDSMPPGLKRLWGMMFTGIDCLVVTFGHEEGLRFADNGEVVACHMVGGVVKQ